MKKILRPHGAIAAKELEEIAKLLAGPNGTVELTPDGWVYENLDHATQEKTS